MLQLGPSFSNPAPDPVKDSSRDGPRHGGSPVQSPAVTPAVTPAVRLAHQRASQLHVWKLGLTVSELKGIGIKTHVECCRPPIQGFDFSKFERLIVSCRCQFMTQAEAF